jgi:hypothetical protein
MIASMQEWSESKGVNVAAGQGRGGFVLSDNVAVSTGVRLSRTRKYKDASFRQILNDLVRPFNNVVWVSRYRAATQEGDVPSFVVSLGSWRVNRVKSPGLCVARLVKALQFQREMRSAAVPGYPRAKEQKTDLYVHFMKAPEETKKALDAAVEKSKSSDVRKELQHIQKYLTNDTDGYTRSVGASF